MSFYKMFHKGQTNAFGLESNVVLEQEHRGLLILDDKTQSYVMPDYPEPVPLTLRLSDAFYNEYHREYRLRFSHFPDFFPKSDAHVFCFSNALKDILNRFFMPEHRFYNALVTDPKTSERRSDYWILLLKIMYYSEIYLPGTEWELLDRFRGVVVERFEKGRIKSLNEIVEIRKRYEDEDEKAGKEPYYTYYPSVLCYKQPFDIIPFSIDEMLVSEPVKLAIEQSDFGEDIGFEKLDYTIITGYQD